MPEKGRSATWAGKVMGKESFVDKESAILKEVDEWFQTLQSANECIAKNSLVILEEEHKLFCQAMIFQVAAIKWVDGTVIDVVRKIV